MAATQGRHFVNALARGLAILECLSKSGRELTVSEIAKQVALPQPTVWRLCRTLLDLGYIVRARSSDHLGLGIPVLGLGYSVLRGQTIAEIARSPMQEVAERFQAAVSLGAPSGLEIIFLQRCQSKAASLTDLRVGMKMPIAHSASGWVYLACLPAKKRAALLASIRAVEGARWDYLEPRYKAAMATWPSKGFLLQKGLLHSELNVVAVPVRGARDGEIFTLSGGGIASVFGDEVLTSLGHALVELAGMLTNCLRDEAHGGAATGIIGKSPNDL